MARLAQAMVERRRCNCRANETVTTFAKFRVGARTDFNSNVATVDTYYSNVTKQNVRSK